MVWSEVAYLTGKAGADTAVAGLRRWLDGGHLVAVHYTGATGYPEQATPSGRGSTPCRGCSVGSPTSTIPSNWACGACPLTRMVAGVAG
ncbi:MAG: hypothetical protein R2749_21100 [Acidimicrobiales bacterium]